MQTLVVILAVWFLVAVVLGLTVGASLRRLESRVEHLPGRLRRASVSTTSKDDPTPRLLVARAPSLPRGPERRK